MVSEPRAAQMVGREPRERVSQEAFVNQSWRYRFNSNVRHLSLMTRITYHEWTFDSDIDLTRAGYEAIAAGGPKHAIVPDAGTFSHNATLSSQRRSCNSS
jgi:hypothetical protein